MPTLDQTAALAAVCGDRVKFAGSTIAISPGQKQAAEAEGGDGEGEGGGVVENEVVDLLGAPVALVRRDDFLYLCINGEAYPLAVYKWRFFEGNKIVACRHMELNSMTWRKHGGCDWVIDEATGTISPSKAPQFVLGLRLVDDVPS